MKISGNINLPGDKSISHRALMFASLTNGECVIHNISTGEDVESTRKCLAQCGIQSTKLENKVKITGGAFSIPLRPLDCGNSGTSIRLLAGLLSGKGITAEFIGDDSLSMRPMNRIIEPLIEMGVKIDSKNGYLPLAIKPEIVKGFSFSPSIASAQVKSCIMLAGFGAEGETIITEKVKTRDHSEIILKELGAPVSTNGKIKVEALSTSLQPFNMTIPGDPSSAAFFATAAAIIPNSSLTIKNVLANPTRIGFFDVLKKMGGGVEWKNMHKECGELVGDVHVYWAPLNGIDITAEMVPSVIDELPIIAILATQADGPTSISGAEELRVKECDRIKAVCENLTAMGGEIIEKKDGFIINPPSRLYNTNIKTFGDHRIAMSFTIAGLLTESRNILDDEDCINISFPEFNSVLHKISQ